MEEIDARVDSAAREGLTGTRLRRRPSGRDETEISTAPDGAPPATQPRWRRDVPIDWPVNQSSLWRDFAKFLVLTSGVFVAGQSADRRRGYRGRD